MPFTISKPNFKLEWHNLKLYFMKTLELNQMENLQGGNALGCAAGATGMTVGLIAAASIVTAGAAALFLVGWVASSIALSQACTE